MRLTWGEPPISKGFDPEAEGYVPMKEPSASVLSYLGGAIGLVMAVASGWILWSVIPPLRADPWTVLFDTESNDGFIFLAALLGMLAVIVPVHELIHFVLFPAGRERGIGVWPRKFLFYAYTTAPIARGRLVASAAMPFLLLTVLPSIVLLATGAQSVWLFAAVVVHTSLCGGDAMIVGLLLSRVPTGATCRNQGWATYYATR